MTRSRWLLPILFLALGGASLLGFARLFFLRFQAGDVYPPYSSLRADPLGTKVLYDALREAPGLATARNFQPLEKIARAEDATIFYAGARTDHWPATEAEQLLTLARQGARVVITFLPADADEAREAQKRKSEEKKPKSGDTQDEEDSRERPLADIAKSWDLQVGYRKAKPGPEDADEVFAHAVGAGPEPALSWHSPLYFRRLDPAWQVLYRCGGFPVVLERAFGRGTVVLATDSFFLSNEAMRTQRAPRLLALLLGSRADVIFDETHLGVEENPGIATLLRRYHLEGLIAAIGVLAALFVWQTASPFLPLQADRAREQIIAGQSSWTGFVSLLRRGIAPSRLIRACVEQWDKTAVAKSGPAHERRTRIEAVTTWAGAEPVAAYRAISQILAEKK